MLFGHNIEELRDDIPWSNACVCHAMCVEGGMALAAATLFVNGIDPKTTFLIFEGLLFTWWTCGIYTGLFRQSLQKKYHLKVIFAFHVCGDLMLVKFKINLCKIISVLLTLCT